MREIAGMMFDDEEEEGVIVVWERGRLRVMRGELLQGELGGRV